MPGLPVKASVAVPADRAEEAIAAAIELAPGGFAESRDGDRVVLDLYVDDDDVPAISRPSARSR